MSKSIKHLTSDPRGPTRTVICQNQDVCRLTGLTQLQPSSELDAGMCFVSESLCINLGLVSVCIHTLQACVCVCLCLCCLCVLFIPSQVIHPDWYKVSSHHSSLIPDQSSQPFDSCVKTEKKNVPVLCVIFESVQCSFNHGVAAPRGGRLKLKQGRLNDLKILCCSVLFFSDLI